MRRKALGRDFGLSVRMLIVSAILGAAYLAVIVLSLMFAWGTSSRTARTGTRFFWPVIMAAARELGEWA